MYGIYILGHTLHMFKKRRLLAGAKLDFFLTGCKIIYKKRVRGIEPRTLGNYGCNITNLATYILHLTYENKKPPEICHLGSENRPVRALFFDTIASIQIIIRLKSVSPSVYSLSTPTPRLFHFIFSPPPPSSDAIDPAPLLLSGDENKGSNSNGGGEQRRSSSVRRPGLREAARLLSRASSGGGCAMREPSMVVREVAAEQLEERQSDWAYSKPIVVLDIVWNLAFVSVAGAILVMARNEHPIMPLRGMRCSVLVEYRRRNRVRNNRTPRSRSSRFGFEEEFT
ncbi:hypothetical protein YC2023_050649 [Brassica napus]